MYLYILQLYLNRRFPKLIRLTVNVCLTITHFPASAQVQQCPLQLQTNSLLYPRISEFVYRIQIYVMFDICIDKTQSRWSLKYT